jgi:hypothetical protein
MRSQKYHLYLTRDERRTIVNSLIFLKNDLVTRGKYSDAVDELIIKLTKAKINKIKIREV